MPSTKSELNKYQLPLLLVSLLSEAVFPIYLPSSSLSLSWVSELVTLVQILQPPWAGNLMTFLTYFETRRSTNQDNILGFFPKYLVI